MAERAEPWVWIAIPLAVGPAALTWVAYEASRPQPIACYQLF